jgi:hypothetical protein
MEGEYQFARSRRHLSGEHFKTVSVIDVEPDCFQPVRNLLSLFLVCRPRYAARFTVPSKNLQLFSRFTLVSEADPPSGFCFFRGPLPFEFVVPADRLQASVTPPVSWRQFRQVRNNSAFPANIVPASSAFDKIVLVVAIAAMIAKKPHQQTPNCLPSPGSRPRRVPRLQSRTSVAIPPVVVLSRHKLIEIFRVIPYLLTAHQLALHQQYLLVRRKVQEFLTRNASKDTCDFLRRP